MRRINQRGLLATLENEKIEAVAPADAETPTETPASDATPAPTETPAADAPVVSEPAVPAEDPAVTTVVAAADAVEADIAESTDEEADAASMSDATDEAVEVTEALESIRDILAASLPNGGISKTDAGVLKVAVESLNDRVGLGALAQPFPDAEQFDTVSSRMRATKLACESISENAKKIWEKIIAAIKAAIAWLVERWQQFTLNAEKLAKRAEEVIKMAEGTKGEPKEKKFSNSALVNALHIGGEVDAFVGMRELDAVTGRVLKPNTELITAIHNLIEGDKQDMEPIGKTLLSWLEKTAVVEDPAKEGLHVNEGFELFRQLPALPGGKCLLAQLPKSEQASGQSDAGKAEMISKISVTLVDGSPKVKPAEDYKLTTLEPPRVGELAEKVKALCEKIVKSKNITEVYTEAKKKLVTKAEELAKTEGDDKAQTNARARGKIAVWAVHQMDNPVAGFTFYVLLTCKHMLDYGTASLKQYGEEKKPEEKKDAKPAAEPAAA